MTDDPHVQIERLHQQWLELSEELDEMVKPGDWPAPDKRDHYYAKVKAVQQLVQEIMEISRNIYGPSK